MSPMQFAATKLVQCLSDPGSTEEQWKVRVEDMMALTRTTDPVELDAVLKTVTEALAYDNPKRAGFAAGCGIGLVEIGASPAVLGIPLLDRLPDILQSAARFYGNVVELAGMHGEGRGGDTSQGFRVDGTVIPNAIVDCARQELPKQGAAYDTLGTWCLPAIACLSLSVDLRRRAADAGLLPYTAALTGANSPVGLLHTMLRVLDGQPLLVLHPASRQGFECKISGISSNFQLHTILADTFSKDEVVDAPASKPGFFDKLLGRSEPAAVPQIRGWLPGKRPTPHVAAVVRGKGPQQIDEPSNGVWNLYQWYALDEEGSLPRGNERRDSWIWNEGCPADIDVIVGTRVVLLGPPSSPRTWNTQRDFERLKPSLEILKVLTPLEYAEWLTRLVKASTTRGGM